MFDFRVSGNLLTGTVPAELARLTSLRKCLPVSVSMLCIDNEASVFGLPRLSLSHDQDFSCWITTNLRVLFAMLSTIFRFWSLLMFRKIKFQELSPKPFLTSQQSLFFISTKTE